MGPLVGPGGHHYLAWHFLQKVTAGLTDDEGLISLVKGGKGSVSRGGGVCSSSAEGGETTSSNEINP